MKIPVRIAALFLTLVVSACTSSSAAPPMRAARPPSDYLYIAGADLSSSKSIQIETNLTGVGNTGEQNARLSVSFGIFFAGAESEAHSTDLATTGTGLTVADPIRLSPSSAADSELEDVLNVLETRAPAKRNLEGRLYQGPGGDYLVLVNFDTSAGANALYFDVTRWANKVVDY